MCIALTGSGAERREEVLRKKLAVLLAAVMLLVSVFAMAGPAVALPDGNNGNHHGDIRNPDNGKHNGGGVGGGKINNEGKHKGGNPNPDPV